MHKGALRILYLDSPGDLIGAFRHWRAGRADPSQTDATFSGQLFDVAQRLGASVHAVAWPGGRDRVEDGSFIIEHRPPPLPQGRGALFHVAQALWAADISRLALRFHADAMVLAGGPHRFLFAPLRAAGIRLVAVLHNTLWPAGHRPMSGVARAMQAAQGWFFRRVADVTLAVSPECERQVHAISGTLRGPVFQFRPSYSGLLATARGEARYPFRVLFAGRIERDKGVFDVVNLASRLEAIRPGSFHWSICGGGSAEDELAEAVRSRGLQASVTLRGRLQRAQLVEEYEGCDAVIVPTTARFCEGLNRVALEAALSGRPAVISETSPASEVLGSAALTVRAGDLEGYMNALQRLADDRAFYRASCQRAAEVGKALIGPVNSFGDVLTRVLRQLFPRVAG